MSGLFRLADIIKEFKYSIRLAIPLVGAEAIYGLNSFIATIMVSHLGKEQLAANALVWGIYYATTVLFVGFVSAVGVMTAQSFGAKDYAGANLCFKQGLIIATIISIPMMLIMLIMPTILTWTSQDPVVVSYAKPFFYSLTWSMWPFNIWFVIQQFLGGINRVRIVMLMSILAVPIELFCFYVFLFGKLGFPKCGLPGIGYGLAASNFIITLGFSCYLYFAHQFKSYALFKRWWVIEYKFFIELIKIGLPLGLMLFSECLFFAVVAFIMGTLGVTALAAYQIASQYLMIGIVVLMGLVQTVMVRIGNEVGQNNRHKLILTQRVNMGIALMFIAALSIFYITFPQAAISLDIEINAENFKAVANEATKFFPIVGILLITECLRMISCGSLRGLKDSKFQLFISTVGFWLIALPASYFLAFKLGLGGVGIWWGIVFGTFTTGIMLLTRFNRLAKNLDLSLLITKNQG